MIGVGTVSYPLRQTRFLRRVRLWFAAPTVPAIRKTRHRSHLRIEAEVLINKLAVRAGLT